MKKFLLAAAAVLLLNAAADAAPKVINFWHFNNLVGAFHNPGIPPIKANFSVIDTNKAVIVYKLLPGTQSAYAGYIDNVTGTDTNTRMNVIAAGTANNGLRIRNPSDSAYLQFYIPTKGYKNIVMSYVLESSSTTSGMLTQIYDYSVDSGATWKNTGLNLDSLDVTQTKYQGTNWGLVSLNFAMDTAGTNNNNKLVFRIKFRGNTSMISGNNRFDNFVVEGDSIASGTSGTGITQISNNAEGIRIFPNPAKSVMSISADIAAVREARIYDMAGHLLSAETLTGRESQIDITAIPAGVYYLLLRNAATGYISQLRFVKE